MQNFDFGLRPALRMTRRGEVELRSSIKQRADGISDEKVRLTSFAQNDTKRLSARMRTLASLCEAVFASGSLRQSKKVTLPSAFCICKIIQIKCERYSRRLADVKILRRAACERAPRRLSARMRTLASLCEAVFASGSLSAKQKRDAFWRPVCLAERERFELSERY